MKWEEEWWERSTNVAEMIERLPGRVNVRKRGRKLRLFACACCRRLWKDLDPVSRQAVEMAEGFADGLVASKELTRARKAAAAVVDAVRKRTESMCFGPCWTAWAVTWRPSGTRVGEDLRRALHVVHSPELRFRRGGKAVLLREVVGNPFRRVRLLPDWLQWNDSTVLRLAQAAYDHRILPEGKLHNARLAVLADALEEAGCTDADILNHCRQPGEHVRDCWVVDLLVGESGASTSY